MNNIDFIDYKNSKSLVENFVKEVSTILKETLLKKENATLLVSGGNTPKLFFQELSKVKLDWNRVKIGLVDERWLLESNENSNAYLVKKYLIQKEASKASFIPLFLENKDCFSSDDLCSKLYKKEFLQTDILILGMGNDGHTASLFSKSKEIKDALNLNIKKFCISTNPITAPYDRMTLTLKSILESKNLFLHFQGKEKLEIYKKALKSENIYPISKILFNASKLKVYFSHE
ncbi:6-phosphogluconolactonase [Arcobacter sp. LA11]|uniref:6-phosphogluconolactonase n=1 Tax=Arcobacter sp. LA11 TaxID=1898176 RepID=UPI0009353C3F|nr:6-phosphogluconolactonase [Arcobacter sp. LA11]